MNIYTDISSLRTALQVIKKAGLRLAFVPTMGNLHAGHLSLVEKAKQSADRVIVSIFVNPMQFGVNEDFSTYPRSLESDLEKLAPYEVDFIFVPEESAMCPYLAANKAEGVKSTYVSVPGLSDELCGVTRPHFFYGVTTVLAKLFNIVQPDVAILEKDYQQLIIVRRMVEDLNFPIEIIGMPIVREADGLAMSSRNQYLSKDERAMASQLYATLWTFREKFLVALECEGSVQKLVNGAVQSLNQIGFKTDYLSLRCIKTLSPIPVHLHRGAFILLAAVYLGKTRLLDNVEL